MFLENLVFKKLLMIVQNIKTIRKAKKKSLITQVQTFVMKTTHTGIFYIILNYSLHSNKHHT